MNRKSWLARLVLAYVAAIACGMAQAQAPAKSEDIQAKRQQERQRVQPGNNEPIWTEVRSGEANYTSLPGREMGVLIQPGARFPGQERFSTAGEAWRQFRNGPVTVYGGWLVLIVTLAIAAFYFAKGPLKLHERPTGRAVQRFSAAERWAHWTMGISFCVLAAGGLIMLFGKHVLLPVIGYTLFSWLTALAKNLHNFVAPLFIVSLLVFIVMFLKDNVYQRGDFGWLAKGWRMFVHGEHVPSWRFNMGEKVYFWFGVVGLCLTLAVTGLILLFPNFDQVRMTMQQAHVVHVISALVMIVFALGHIYVGTIGVEGAYESMRTGQVDETWAKEHHQLWYDEQKSGKAFAEAGATPATH